MSQRVRLGLGRANELGVVRASGGSRQEPTRSASSQAMIAPTRSFGHGPSRSPSSAARRESRGLFGLAQVHVDPAGSEGELRIGCDFLVGAIEEPHSLRLDPTEANETIRCGKSYCPASSRSPLSWAQRKASPGRAFLLVPCGGTGEILGG